MIDGGRDRTVAVNVSKVLMVDSTGGRRQRGRQAVSNNGRDGAMNHCKITVVNSADG